MTRESESELLSFCATQRGDFCADAWTRFEQVEKREMAAVCLFLAGVDWFGHESGLRETAKKLLGGAETTFGTLARALRFDCPRFANSLKRRLSHA
ncbi:MAG: hypothetical protein U1F81_23565 [Verrucomicrobiaceae bacterium]